MRNNLPDYSGDCFLIVNTEDISKSGSHWQLLWRRTNEKIFFCSFGSHITKEAEEFLAKNILCTDFRIQEWGSKICGELCILIAYLLDKGIRFEDIILELVKTEKSI